MCGDPARESDRPRHQAFRHEHDDYDEDSAEHEVRSLDVSAHHVLDDDNERDARERPQQYGRAHGLRTGWGSDRVVLGGWAALT